MASFYRATVEKFLSDSDAEIIAELAHAYALSGYTQQFTDQTLVWHADLASLKDALRACVQTQHRANQWQIVLEFTIPRKERRIDVVLLIGDAIAIIEAKTTQIGKASKRQLEEYALLLHYFHKGSQNRKILPLLVSEQVDKTPFDSFEQKELFPQLATYWIAPVHLVDWRNLPGILMRIADGASQFQIDAEIWENSPYFPVPSIIEAAVDLRAGLSIREIALSEASEHEVENVRGAIQGYIERARLQKEHCVCFLTGVPGSGKTLVGLGLAHSEKNKADSVHFMSGNGPLVQVLQHLFTQQGRLEGMSRPQSFAAATALIENVHVFAKTYSEKDRERAPANHAIIFDEAQRAWNKAQNLKKFKRDYSEPEMILQIMERHEDWSVIIALVGGGQEINDGEAGLEEWGRAILERPRKWTVCASPEVLTGGPSTAGRRLFPGDQEPGSVETNPLLHLRTSNRSLRAENLAQWVNFVLEGNADAARSIEMDFPIFLTRSLAAAKRQLREQSKGNSRYGLIGSSGAARLRAEGLEPSSAFHANYDWHHWYLAPETDIRSSMQCEVFATEFEVQGLELDWVGVCWGGDYVRQERGWSIRRLHLGAASRWNEIKHNDRRMFRRNAYRVLLTRARQGMVLFVPSGDRHDPTNSPEEFDRTAEFLMQCGAVLLEK